MTESLNAVRQRSARRITVTVYRPYHEATRQQECPADQWLWYTVAKFTRR